MTNDFAQDLHSSPGARELGVRRVRPSAPGGHLKGATHSPAPRQGGVTAHELQKAVLLVLVLYASVAVLNLGAEFSALIGFLRTFAEFVASSVFR